MGSRHDKAIRKMIDPSNRSTLNLLTHSLRLKDLEKRDRVNSLDSIRCAYFIRKKLKFIVSFFNIFLVLFKFFFVVVESLRLKLNEVSFRVLFFKKIDNKKIGKGKTTEFFNRLKDR